MEGNRKQKLAILLALSDWTDQSENSSAPLPSYGEFINLHDEALVNELIDTDKMFAVLPGAKGELRMLWKGIETVFDVMALIKEK
jgi:hypothetical protein